MFLAESEAAGLPISRKGKKKKNIRRQEDENDCVTAKEQTKGMEVEKEGKLRSSEKKREGSTW